MLAVQPHAAAMDEHVAISEAEPEISVGSLAEDGAVGE
jgi:hypothetical protein